MNTRQMIINSAIILFKKKPADKISASDIIACADVSRSTFYRYFKDKYDVIESYLRDSFKKALEESNNDNWDETLCIMTTFSTENRELIKELLQNDRERTTLQFLWNNSYSILKRYYGKDAITEEERLTLNFATAGITRCVFEWIFNDYQMDVQTFSHCMTDHLLCLMASPPNEE